MFNFFWKKIWGGARASTTPVEIMCNTGAAQQKIQKGFFRLVN